jgi:uncharacterized membrane protein
MRDFVWRLFWMGIGIIVHDVVGVLRARIIGNKMAGWMEKRKTKETLTCLFFVTAYNCQQFDRQSGNENERQSS